jgi:hypothetical protein
MQFPALFIFMKNPSAADNISYIITLDKELLFFHRLGTVVVGEEHAFTIQLPR